MGIRVHKLLGWGLTDVKCKNGKIDDPRFSSFSPVAGDYEDRENKFTLENYKNWLKKKKRKDKDWQLSWELSGVEKEEKDNLMRCFVHDAEYGNPKVFCCIPVLNFQEWFRYDDLIDYYEVSLTGKGPINKAKILDVPIYPHLGFMDSRDGRKVDDQYSFCFSRERKTKNKNMIELDRLAKESGFSNYEEAQKYFSPIVCPSVRYMVEFANVFVDNNTIFQMKPMIYTYWS